MKWLCRWYSGETKITEFENDATSSVISFPLIYVEYHWSAKVARSIVGYYLKHWQWLWMALIGLATLYVTYLGLAKQ